MRTMRPFRLLAVAGALLAGLTPPAAAAPRAVLVNDPFDPSITDAAGHVRSALQALGFDVTESSSVPPDLAPYRCAWDLRVFAELTSPEQDLYLALLARGHGLLVLGEN